MAAVATVEAVGTPWVEVDRMNMDCRDSGKVRASETGTDNHFAPEACRRTNLVRNEPRLYRSEHTCERGIPAGGPGQANGSGGGGGGGCCTDDCAFADSSCL